MIVAMISAEYPPQPGGVGDYTYRLGQKLAERGQHALVFTIADSRFQIVDLAIPPFNLQSTIYSPKSNWGWPVWRDIRRAIEQIQPDILHIQYQTGAYGMHPAINFLPWRLRRVAHRPAIVVTAHDLLPPYLFPKAGPLRQWVTRRLLADADAVVLTNEQDYRQVREWEIGDGTLEAGNLPHPFALIPIGSNIVVAPGDGYDRAAWRARLQVGADQTLLAYFGLISHTKGLDSLLEALARLPAGYRLLIV
ncbi:MAG TPA: glycosyltransferase, partial [Roseiflexaceae bacterium]|nr:glycosyltransferase [Roseiflexaceae bacterium]